ncbi:hypothetical protein PQR66_34430 [Paraburkholderia agricolaris]|uniref:Uncharacterized protein n=1 Tax=Paraburkholderia agricolaris TaxID=2152888 RepID=A0ABW9A0V8_9BURK
MTNDRQNGTGKRHVQPLREIDDRRERAANNSRINWAWAHGRAGYDWMDSHHLSIDFTDFTDFTEAQVQTEEIIE